MPREAAGAGWIYSTEQFLINFPAGTGQVTSYLSHPLNRRGRLIGATMVAVIPGTGAGASRTFNIRRGSLSGPVVATSLLVLADLDAVADAKEIPVAAGAGGAEFLDGDAVTVEWATAGAVAWTAGLFQLSLRFRQQLQQRN